MEEEEDERKNIFRELVPQAKKVLNRYMFDSTSPKLAIQVAESILDRAGETRKTEERMRTPIIITNSQVAILNATADEVERRITLDGELYEPTSKELEDARKRE